MGSVSGSVTVKFSCCTKSGGRFSNWGLKGPLKRMEPKASAGGKHGILLQELIAITTATSIEGDSDPLSNFVSVHVDVD